MSTEAKPSSSTTTSGFPVSHREKGIRIFMWPKVIFLYPTAIVALICAIGMSIIHDRTHDPTKSLKAAIAPQHLPTGAGSLSDEPATSMDRVGRFLTPQNQLAMLFLAMFAFNLLVMALDFPRFSRRRIPILLALFFILWLRVFLNSTMQIHAIFRYLAVANKASHGLCDLDVGLRGHLHHAVAGLLGSLA
jgi:hypothetical protein